MRISRKHDLTQLDEECFYALNYRLVPQIIENYPEWGTHLESGKEPYWKNLELKSGEQFIKESAPEKILELGKNWDLLDPEAQRYIRRIFGNVDELFLHVQILARLAERQEKQIAELEGQTHSAHISGE